ncbi:MAG: enoyl-CoA hydratase/isomerase family protein [Desulfobacteraceae bacterium]|nr:enoyl-CoA hydratase/isomerase family protein [Desulfobacteraceae bacterium]
MTTQNVLVNVQDHVANVTLNRPHSLNALNDGLKYGLIDALQKLDKDESTRAIILTGTGKAFCAGGDIQGFKKRYNDFKARDGCPEYYSNILGETILNISKPIIAAINGPAIGGGLSIAIACDIRIASENAVFSAAYLLVGATPEIGSSYILPRLIGLGKASELVFTGKKIDSSEAEKIGLVNKVVPEAELKKATYEIAKKIASLSPVAVRLAKKALRHGMESTLAQALDYETHIITYCFGTQEHNEAVTALLNRQKSVDK